MKKIFAFFIIAVLATSCHQEYDIPTPQKERDILPAPTRLVVGQLINEDLMFLGPRLENPYAVTTMQEARRQLMEEDPSLNIPEITSSHIYARFAPANDDELYTLLQDSTIHFFDFPLDREVISGVYYHDPAIVDSLPTYQYASIPIETWIRDYADSNISYEVLESLFIPEDDEDFFSGGGNDDGGSGRPGEIFIPTDPENPFIPFIPGDGEIDPNTIIPSSEDIIDMLVNRAMYLTGNLDSDGDASVQSVASTNSSSSAWTPSGTITAWDDIVGGQTPLAGVKVWAHRWFTIREGITDANGNFTCDGTLKGDANYYIKWERAYWDIREGDMGQAYYNEPSKISGEWNLSITSATPKSLAYSAIHRALYRIYYKDNEGLCRPNLDIKLKLAYKHNSSSDAPGENYNDWQHNIGIAPKVKIYGLDTLGTRRDRTKILATTFHEVAGHVAHSCHCEFYSSLTTRYKEAWAICAQFYFSCCEYEELGVIGRFNVYDQFGSGEDYWFTPDDFYNWQGWTKKDSIYDANYPPIFIDLLDNCNQYEIMPNSVKSNYPNDKIYFNHIRQIEQIVYTSTDFNQVKNSMNLFCNEVYPPNVYPILDRSELVELFDYYEY